MKCRPRCARRGVQLARDRGRGGGVVDEHGCRASCRLRRRWRRAPRRAGRRRCRRRQRRIGRIGRRFARRRRLRGRRTRRPRRRPWRRCGCRRVTRCPARARWPGHRVAHHPQAEEGHASRGCRFVGAGAHARSCWQACGLAAIGVRSHDRQVLGAGGQVAVARALAVQLDLQPQVVHRVGVAQRVFVGDLLVFVEVEQGSGRRSACRARASASSAP